LIYAAAGAVWIVFSSVWVSVQARPSPETFLYLELLKGLLFIAFTSALLWGLCRFWSRQINHAIEDRESAQLLYATYVAASPISIGVFNRKGEIIEANRANQKLTGYSCEELEQMTIFELDVSESTEETSLLFEEVFQAGSVSKTRILRRKDGTHVDVEVDCVRLNEERAICFSRDITERIHSERKLVMLNAMLRAIRRVNQVIVKENEVTSLIQKICEVLVQDRDFKHAWIALLDADGRPDFYCDAPKLPDASKLRAFLDEGKLEECFAGTHREDGLIVSKNPRSDCPNFPLMTGLEDAALLGMRFNFDHRVGYIALMAKQEIVEDEEEIGLFREICEDLQFALHTIRTEQEKTEAMQQAVEAKRDAENANRAKDDFLAVMSHEMRTPLNPIIGFSELLLEDLDSEPEKTYVATIQQAGKRQLALIDDILHYTRLQRSAVTPDKAPLRLVELGETIIRDTAVNFPDLDMRFTTGEHGGIVDPETEVVSDEKVIRSILDNLIQNAGKYTKRGHVNIDISKSNEHPGQFLFNVEDSGIGIQPETIGKLFKAFSQADSSYTRRHEGVGLGLAICKKLVELLEGEISVQSTPGEGSTFTVRLPLAASSNARVDLEGPVAQKPIKDSHLGHSLSILAVDDKSDNLFVLEQMLSRLGGRLDRAENGAVAVELCRKNTYDVILMDLAMPVMNGLDAAKAIRASGLNQQTPIIAVTADASSEARESCLKVGMQDLLTKPIEGNKLIQMIRDHTD
jgi:PAS domain S-box-containing protein